MSDAADETLSRARTAGDERSQPEPLEDAEHGASFALARGQIVGRFVILSPLGRGGMGAVYSAHDPEIERNIALKLHFGQGAVETERLLREARALGKVSHPSVVVVHDVGTHRGRVWLAMEQVHGQTLDAWLEQAGGRRPWREAVAVMRAAGEGLVAVHAAGLVHRDLKPSNLMIDADGRARVMDFGVVRAELEAAREQSTDQGSIDASSTSTRAVLTRTGAMVGTPAYMAPEQFRGHRVDARSDQFAFCVVLWQALYGERPFAGESVAQLQFAVLHDRRRPPPAGVAVPQWLRTTIERGLASDPEARWPSMRALLDALDTGHRRALVRRAVAGLAAVAVVVTGGGLYQRWAEARALAEARAACAAAGSEIEAIWNDDARSELEAVFSSLDSPLAAETWPRLEAGIGAYAEGWAEAREQTCIATEVERTRSPSSAADTHRCLDDCRTSLASLVGLLHDTAIGKVGDVQDILEQLRVPASCLDEHAVASYGRLPEDPDEQARVQAVRARFPQTQVLIAARQPGAIAEAEATVRAARELGFGPLVAEAEYRLGYANAMLGQIDAAASAFEDTLFLAAEHGDDELAVRAATELINVASERAEYQQGLHWEKLARVLISRSPVEVPLREIALDAAVASLHHTNGARDEALVAYRRTLAASERHYPSNHPAVGKGMINLCLLLSERGELVEAEPLCDHGLEIKRLHLPSVHPALVLDVTNVGIMYLENDEPELALSYFTECLEIGRATMPPAHPDLGYAHNNIGAALLELGRPGEALLESERALELWTQGLGADHPAVTYALTTQGRALVALGRYAEAREPLERAVASRSRGGFAPEDLAETQWYLARALGADDFARERAEELARAALEIYRAEPNESTTVAEIEAWLRRNGHH